MKRESRWSRVGWLLLAVAVLFPGTAGAQGYLKDFQGCSPWAQGNLGNAFLNVQGKKFYSCQTAIDVVKNMQENWSQIAVFQELAYESICRTRVGDYAGTAAWWNYCKLPGHWADDICCGCPYNVDENDDKIPEKKIDDNLILYGKDTYERENGGTWSYTQIPLLVCNPHDGWKVPLPFEVFSKNAAYPNVLLACAKWEIVQGPTIQGGDLGYPEFNDSGFFGFMTVEPDGIKPDLIYSVYLPSDLSVKSKHLVPATVRKDFIDRFRQYVAFDPLEWIAAGDWNFDPYWNCETEDAKAFLNLLTVPRVGVCSDPNGGPCLMMDADGKRSSVCPIPWTAGILGTLDMGVGNNHRYCTTGRGITHPRPTRATDHDLVPHDCGYCGDSVCNQSNLDIARGSCEWWKNCCTDCPIPDDLNPNCSRHCCVTNDPPCKPWSTKVIFCCPNPATTTPTNQTHTDPNSPNPPCTDVCKCGCPPGTTEIDIDTQPAPECSKAHDLP